MRTDSPWTALKAQLPTVKLGGVVVVIVYSPFKSEALSKYIKRV